MLLEYIYIYIYIVVKLHPFILRCLPPFNLTRILLFKELFCFTKI